MNPRMTRNQLVRRGAAGLTVLSLPGLLAACGGGGGGGDEESSGEVEKTLNFANWPLYIDVDEKTKKHPTLDAFTAATGIKVNYFEEINDNAEYFATVQAPLSQGQSIDRDIFVFTDNSRFPGLLVDQGWVEKLDKDLIPNISNLIDAQASPSFDPNREYSLPWQSGMTGIAWNEDVTGPVDVDRAAARGPEAQGQDHDAAGDGRLGRPRHPRERRRPGEGRRRGVQPCRRPDPGSASTRGRSAASPATTTPARSRTETSLPRWHGRETSSSCSSTTRSSSGRSRRTAG